MEEKRFNEERIKDLLEKEKKEESHTTRQGQIITLVDTQIHQIQQEIAGLTIDEENVRIIKMIETKEG
jgi:hypothetical protein